jgi:uncharacterized membrane protein YjfL (UPF0719 family)
MTATQSRAIISLSFAVFWLGVLYAGADHPPPVGFLWLIPFVLICAAVVYWRLPAYATWSRQRRPQRIPRVAFDGLVAGLVVALVASLGTWTDATTTSWVNVLIWACVLGGVGLVNALVVYALALVVQRVVSKRGRIYFDKIDASPLFATPCGARKRRR